MKKQNSKPREKARAAVNTARPRTRLTPNENRILRKIVNLVEEAIIPSMLEGPITAVVIKNLRELDIERVIDRRLTKLLSEKVICPMCKRSL